jgi:formylglycine-generating enzyme required for sulfatase activity
MVVAMSVIVAVVLAVLERVGSAREESGCGCGVGRLAVAGYASPIHGTVANSVPGSCHEEDMIYIEGGLGYIGTDNPAIWRDGEGPRRPVVVSDFQLDVHEVTNQGTSTCFC